MYEYLLLHSVLFGIVLRVKYMERVHVKTGEVVMMIFIASIITRVGKWVLSNTDNFCILLLLCLLPYGKFCLERKRTWTASFLAFFLKKQHPGCWQCWSPMFV